MDLNDDRSTEGAVVEALLGRRAEGACEVVVRDGGGDLARANPRTWATDSDGCAWRGSPPPGEGERPRLSARSHAA